MSVLQFRQPKKLPEVLLDIVRQGKPAPAPEVVSRGLLRVEIFLTGGSWLSLKPDRYLVRAVECVDTYLPMEGECEDLLDVRNFVTHFRQSAKARHLTFELHNRTGLSDAELGIT